MSEKPATDSYKSIYEPSKGLYKELGSKFISFACPVSSGDEIKGILSKLRGEYFDAKHHCYAYRLGLSGDIWRTSDDGEPSSSAGRPILGQIISYGLSDILIVVVRYFGGTKLGIPGLMKAYKSAAADAIENSRIIEKTAFKALSFSFNHIDMEAVMKLVKSYGVEITKQSFDMECSMTINVRVSKYSSFLNAISDKIYYTHE